jgi:hypothetical protein
MQRMKRFFAAVIGVAAIDAMIAVAGGQSLADVARKETERRKSVGAPGRLYTNKDLSRVSSFTPDQPDTAAGAAPPALSAPIPAGPQLPPGSAAPVNDLEASAVAVARRCTA